MSMGMELAGSVRDSDEAAQQARMETTIDFLDRNARQHSALPAMYHKTRGLWTVLTWLDTRDRVADLSARFDAAGLKAGDVLVIAGDGTPLVMIGLLAAQWLGLEPLVVPTDMTDDETAALQVKFRIKGFLTDGYDKVEQVARTSNAKSDHIFFCAEKPLQDNHIENCYFVDLTVRNEGGSWTAAVNVAAEARAARTVDHRGRIRSWTHADLLSFGHQIAKIAAMDHRDRIYCQYPLCWSAEFALTHAAWLVSGSCLHFPESVFPTLSDRLDVAPTVAAGNPEALQIEQHDLSSRIRMSGVTRRLFDAAPSPESRTARRASRMADVLIKRPLLRALGLRNLRAVIFDDEGTGISPDFYGKIGLRVAHMHFSADERLS